MNSELKKKGFIVISGRVSRLYFNEKVYGSREGSDQYVSVQRQENREMIREFKSKGNSYRQILINIREATGEDLSYSTVRYLYKKYIENDEKKS